MNTKISKINMNKVIVLMVSFFILIVLTFIINSFSKYEGKDNVTNNKNEYSIGNKVTLNEENPQVVVESTNNDIEIEEIKETEPEMVVSGSTSINSNNQTIEYFESAEEEIALLIGQDEEKISSKVKTKFVELVDFIFYGTEINGVTFNELTEDTKQKLIEIVNRIDNKIEEKVPGYKDTISNGAKESYTFLIDKLKQGIDYADSKIEEKIGTEKYDEIKENMAETTEKVKDSGSVAVEKGKELIETTKEKIKDWYEGWK